jgi:prepilin-type N-terminal cleavage/methylation domain-containing protein
MNRTPDGSHAVRRNGFTLIELLVVIAIIGLVIGITLPALAGARTSARQTLSVSNVRSIAQTFELYAGSHRTYPFPGSVEGPAGNTGTVYSMNWYATDGQAFIATSEIWPMATLWPALISSITPWDEAFETWVSPGREKTLPTIDDIFGEREPQDVVSYELCHGFLARARNWSRNATADPALIGPTKPSDVRSPSSKAMLFDSDLTYLRTQPEIVEGHYDAPTPIAFADAHAEVRSPLKATAGAPNPLNGTDIRRLHNTPDGLLGSDY